MEQMDQQVKYTERLAYTKKDGTQSIYKQKYYVKGGHAGRKVEPITIIKNQYKDLSKEQRKLLLNCFNNLGELSQIKDKIDLVKADPDTNGYLTDEITATLSKLFP